MGRTKGGSNKKRDGGASSAPQTVEGISDDQVYSLTEQHRQSYEKKLAAKKVADKALKDLGKIIKADLGASGLQDIKDLITMGTPEGEATMKAEMERQARIMRWMNIPIGSQGGLFATEDRTPLKDRAFAEGKRQGLAGETISNPHHHTTEAHRAHVEGYEAGQSINAGGIKKLKPEGDGDSDDGETWSETMTNQNARVEADIKAAANLGSSRPSFTTQ